MDSTEVPSQHRSSEFTDELERLLATCRKQRGGKVADYIPELASADPNLLGCAVCAVDGSVDTAGDADEAFTIQSVCKPFLYAEALATFGSHAVHERVGVEPTGQGFNAFTRLEAKTHRPRNPMVNAGAIAVVDLLTEAREGAAPGAGDLTTILERCAGRESLKVDESVFRSERSHATRNRVIAYLMKHFDMVHGDVERLLDWYFKVCSVRVTCRDLSVMAGCLANGGRNPLTGTDLWPSSVVDDVLTVMMTCGVYDCSGRFAYEVGMPSKSGVSGAFIGVEPGRYGIAVYSPPLDQEGNSVRGWSFLRRLSRARQAHALDVRPHRPAALEAIDLDQTLRRAREGLAPGDKGALADYLPSVDPSAITVSICCVDGQEQTRGDTDIQFSLQAVANPLAFARCLQTFGDREVRRLVGVEPSGNPFHAIVVDQRNSRPYNPLGNAGALAISGLNTTDGAWIDRLCSHFAEIAGEPESLRIDDAILKAERDNGNRNRAIANLLLEVGALRSVDDALEAYFRQCACLVDIRTLARMGATLANGGVSPVSGKRVYRRPVVKNVLTVMYSCGMHDLSGQFAMSVGLPAKSGVSGGILAVVPGRMGIAVYSPPVDKSGTSALGRRVLQELSAEFDLGLFSQGFGQ